MMKSSRTLLALGAVALLGYGGLRAVRGGGDHDVAADPGLLENRAWFERAPEKATEPVHVFFAMSQQASGLFYEGSAWAGRFERFEYERSGNEVRLVFPQSSKKARFKYKVTSCHDKDGFDLCLDVEANPWGGPKRYYGASEQSSLPSGARELGAAIAAAPSPHAVNAADPR
ncbi:MAG TPA: hypothetical protein VGM56_00020 [Byssovorax sp.]|jgi:hypothetical protein